jgi:hypothetical protein
MIERALAGLFKVVTEEAAQNPAFARRLEDALDRFAESHVERRRAERNVEGFHPLLDYAREPEGFEGRLARFDVAELKLLIEMHNLDPSRSLGAKTSKRALTAHIASAAMKRTQQDARLFEY